VDAPVKNPSFVSLSLPAGKEYSPGSALPSAKLTLILPNNIELVIPEQSPEKTSKLIHALVKELSSCSI
jgi:hypothetical protein